LDTNNATIDFSNSLGSIGIYAPGGKATNKGRILVGKTDSIDPATGKTYVDTSKITYGIGMAAGYTWTKKDLENLLEQITEAVKREGVASKLDDADIARDKAVRALGKIFSGYKNISLPAIQPHGEKLSEVFKKYGTSIAKKSYSEETHLIESLLKDLQNPNLSASITALTGVSEAIADLRNKQNAFAEVRAKYDDSMAQHQTLPSASSLKKPLYELINNKIIIYLNAMEVVEKEKFGSFIASSISSALATPSPRM